MIERFNFYDLYAYLVPGLALLVSLWLPFVLLGEPWPAPALASALAAVFVGYLVGILLHEISREAPFLSVDPPPSSTMLDASDKQLSEEFKQRIRESVSKNFRISLAIGDGQDATLRKETFAMARNRVIQSKRGIYVEQFQGMYGLMRGVCAASMLAFAWYLGWIVYGLFWLDSHPGAACRPWIMIGVVLSTLWILVMLYLKDRSPRGHKFRKLAWWGWCALTFSLGLSSGAETLGSTRHVWMLVAPTVLILLTTWVCAQSYERYTVAFAREVYTAFCDLPSEAGPGQRDP